MTTTTSSTRRAIHVATTCSDCRRPVEVDPFHGKPAGARGFCLGTSTCIQQPPATPDYMERARVSRHVVVSR